MIPAGLSAKEVCELRLGCIEALSETFSKNGLTNGELFSICKQAYDFVVEPLGDNLKGQAKAPDKK